MQILNSTFVIAIMGVDGSGKSTLANHLNRKLKKKYIKIQNLHLRPYFFLTDTSTVNTNPHNIKKKKLKIISFFTILVWLFMYRIFFFFNLKKKNQLIIFDRYAHDLLIDKVRYRFNLSKKITRFILKLFPKPNLWIFLNPPIKIIEKRKKELPTHELIRQSNEYKKLLKKESNVITVNTEQKTAKNISLIVRKMKSIII
jgi:thymidylate kinase